jgi:hypothetical protein
VLREHGGPARERVDDPGREAQALRVHGREGERREAVVAGRLARPHIVVAGRLDAAEELAVGGERDARERDGQGPAEVGHISA